MGLFSQLLAYLPQVPRLAGSIVSDGESRWWFGGNTWSVGETHAGESVNQDSLMTSATCFACTKALSESIAGLPSSVYRNIEKRKEEDRGQSAYELLSEQPNPEMDAFTFWELAIARLVNRGNFFAEIQRDNQDRPIALWPIHNSRVRPLRDDGDGSLYWEVAHDYQGTPDYSDPTWRQRNLTYLSPHNMLNIVGFGSYNGIMSAGMLPAAQEIGIDFATRKYGGSFFAKGAKLQGVVEHPGFIDNEGKRNLFRNDINRIHTSEANAHGIGVLWQGAKYNQISVSPEQAQFLETRKFTRQQLCEFYGVAPAIIGDYADSKFATADAMIRAFVMLTLRNLVVRVEKAVNRQVLNVRGENGRMQRAFSKPLIYQMALDGLLRGDPKAQAETHRVYREGGVLSANEIREEIGYNPTEGEEGDYRIVNGGMARLDKIDEQGNRPGNAEKQDESDDKDASLPKFDRIKLAEMIESSGLIEKPTQVRGATLSHDVVVDAAVDLAVEAVDRIHSIASSQVARWREQDPDKVSSSLTAFWTKQESRLTEALAPCQKLVSRIMPESKLCECLVQDYLALYSPLDNYQIFDAKAMKLFDVAEYVKGRLQ